MLNKVFLEPDGLSVGGTQLVTTGGGVSVANSLYVGVNTTTRNLTVTGTLTGPNTALPAFSAQFSQNPLQTNISFSTTQVFYTINFTQTNFDTNGCYNPSPNPTYLNGIWVPPYSWAPNIPGYYQINTGVQLQSTNITTNNWLYLFKQFAQVSQFSMVASQASSAFYSGVISSVVYMNGVSDFVNVQFYPISGTTWSTNGNYPTANYFNGCFLRPA